MVVHALGKGEIQVQFLLRAPQKCGIMESSGVRIMDNTGDFYSLNVGSIPARRTKFANVAELV